MDTYTIFICLTFIAIVAGFAGLSGHRWAWVAGAGLAITIAVLTTPAHQAAMPWAGLSLMPWNTAEEHGHWEKDGVETSYRVHEDGKQGVVIHTHHRGLHSYSIPYSVRISEKDQETVLTPINQDFHYVVTPQGDLEFWENGAVVYRERRG